MIFSAFHLISKGLDCVVVSFLERLVIFGIDKTDKILLKVNNSMSVFTLQTNTFIFYFVGPLLSV